MKEKLKKIVRFILNPRLFLCLGIAWLITNGWSYIMLGIGTFCEIEWMIWVSSAYLAFLWLPISPEKIVTVAIAIILMKFLFPHDQRTLAVLVEMKEKVKSAIGKMKDKRK